jgi:hypothetical protein
MGWKGLVGWLLAACQPLEGSDQSTDGLDDSVGDVDGVWEVGGETVDFAGGIAYGGAFAFEGRAVLALTTWSSPSCAGDADAWLGEPNGFKLEVPYDEGSATEDAKLFDCEPLDGGGFSCATVAFPRARLAIEELGLDRGESVRGTLEILDSSGRTEADVAFDVVYCGED